MEEINESQNKSINIGKLTIEFHGGTFKAVGFGIVFGEGAFWQSLRLEITFLCFYGGWHFIWDNPPGEATP